MSDTTKQPTILIKKADGTSVRMTLAEFAEYKKQTAAPVSVASSSVPRVAAPAEPVEKKADVVVPTSSDVEKKSDTVANVGTALAEAPAHEVVVAKPGLPAVLPEEPSLHEVKHKDLPTLPGTRDELLGKVLKKLSFDIRPELLGRAASLVQSRLKDIRNDAEVIEYASREEHRGGLGLGPEDAAMFLGAIKEAGNVTQKKPLPKQRPAIEKPIRSLPRPTPISTTGGPSVPIQPVRPVGLPVSPAQSASRPTSIPIPGVPDFTPSIPRTTTGRPLMHDMVPPAPPQERRLSVGPVEELRTIALADFRRLGKDTAARLPVLLQKFSLLKKDSYLLFIEGRDAWVTSPLYRTYEGIIRTALQQGKPVTQVISEQESQDSLTFEEFQALAQVGKSIET